MHITEFKPVRHRYYSVRASVCAVHVRKRSMCPQICASNFAVLRGRWQVHFQGVLVVCDDIPRYVQYAEESPRKRKAPSSEGKAADVILVDKTGPISACLWGEIAEDICSVWRQVQERRQRGEATACVVDLSKVRIQREASNSWNGGVAHAHSHIDVD